MTNLTFNQEQAIALYESSEEFPVDFDKAWQWLGYSSKQAAKKKLSGNFEKGLDYLSDWMSVAHSNGSLRFSIGRSPQQKLNINLLSHCNIASVFKAIYDVILHESTLRC
jgi:hypothetical protein